jgi:ribose/xylose/arabinose/galactoside ABC-type transport system permease subunit
VSRLNPSVRRFLSGGAPFLIFGLVIMAFLLVPFYSTEAISPFNGYNTLQSASSVGLLALAVGLSMIAGEFDLSTVGMYALGGMLAVKFGGTSPVLGVLIAMAAGVVVGSIQGGVIAKLGISSVPVTLGGYIALLGLTNVISGGESVAYENFNVGLWLDQEVLTYFSPRSLIMLGAFAGVAALLRWTRIGRDLRAVGGDRRAARAAGVRTDRFLIGTFIATAVISALAGALLSFSIATAKPDPGGSPLVFAVTAALLGGVTLAGGKGTAVGILAGVLSLSLLEEIFVIVATPDYLSNLVLGGLLMTVVAFDAPRLRDRAVALRSRAAARRMATLSRQQLRQEQQP